jgi:hypothetical protein
MDSKSKTLAPLVRNLTMSIVECGTIGDSKGPVGEETEGVVMYASVTSDRIPFKNSTSGIRSS